MLRASLVSVVLILVAAIAPSVEAAASLSDRATWYQEAHRLLPELQNADGGWGRPVAEANASSHSTQATAASLLETVLTVHVLRADGFDPHKTYTSWEGTETSLAASNVSSALSWLHDYEASNQTDLGPGEQALSALAYQQLGDEGNARRLLTAVFDRHDADSQWSALETAQILYAHAGMPYTFNETQNATIASAESHLAENLPAALDALSWSLLVEADTSRADVLAQRLDDPAAGSTESRSLGAWALAANGHRAGADAILIQLYERAPVSAARVYTMFAERTLHPAFAPNAPDVPTAKTGLALPSRAAQDAASTGTTESAAPAPASGLATSEDKPGGGFPLPTWLMAVMLLVALSGVVATGLAYGLKREDLQGSRREIFTYIEKNPGAHFSRIRRDLGYAPGTFQHHLSVLESDGWITSHKESRYKRYFVNGNRYQKLIAGYTYKQRFAALANETTRSFVTYVKDHPGATQKQVAARLNIHASTVNWHANRLKQAGILTPERVGKEVRYHVDSGEVDRMLKVPAEDMSYASIPAT